MKYADRDPWWFELFATPVCVCLAFLVGVPILCWRVLNGREI